MSCARPFGNKSSMSQRCSRTKRLATQRIWLFAFAYLALIVCADASPLPLQLKHDQASQALKGHVEFIFDETHALHTIDDVEDSSLWRPLGEKTFTNALRPGIVWLRFRVANVSTTEIERIIQVQNGFTDSTTAWIQHGSKQSTRFEAGEDTALSARAVPHFLPRFPLRLPSGAEALVTLRLVDEGSISAPLKIATRDYLSSNDGARQWVYGLMSGVFGLVAIYSFVLFIRVRRRLFGWLGALAVASLLEWVFCHWGHGGLLLPTDSRGWLANRVIITCFELTAFCTFYFYIEACDLRDKHPRLTKIAQAFAWLGLLNTILVFIIPYSISVDLLFMAPIGLVVMAFAVLARALRGDRVAQRLALAAVFLVLGYLLSAFTESGVIPRTWLSAFYIPLGALSQWILFSDAVASRARQLEDQRRAALEAQVAEERRTAELREAFGRYVTPGLAQKILDDPEATALGGRIQNITILMSDLRGFSSMPRRLGPPAMCALLNDYLDRMTEVIDRHGGWINDFIGDGILTVFGTPVANENDALDACRCAIEMQIALEALNEELKAVGRPTLEMGIGIHSGEAIVGNIGSKRRVKWGVLGDPVNIAARIESLSIGTQILLSAAVLNKLPTTVVTENERSVQVKGRAKTLSVCELRSIADEGLAMPDVNTFEDRALQQRARVSIVVDKVVSDETYDAVVVLLGQNRLVFESETRVAEDVDLALRFERDGDWGEPLYGKVGALPSSALGSNETSMHITSIAPATRMWLQSLVPKTS